MSQSYIHGQRYAPDQPLMFPFHPVTIEGSQYSFQSNLSTHPSSGFMQYASGPESGFTSELGSQRAASFLTPSTPANSNNGELAAYLGEASPGDCQSPNDHGRTLQGISPSNYDAGIYGWRGTSEPDSPFDGNGFGLLEAQTESTKSISAHIPAPENLSQTPWSSEDRVYHGQSHPADLLEESEEFQRSLDFNSCMSWGSQGIWQPYAQQEGIRNNGFQGYGSIQQHWQATAAVHGNTYREIESLGSNSPSSSSSANACSPANGWTVPPKKTGGRTGPLSEPARQNARFMRANGCCFRCFVMKEKCVLDNPDSGDQICQRCRKIMHSSRSWGLPCTRIGLDERAMYMVPGFLRNQLQPPQVSAFVNKHVERVVPSASIVLHLTMGFGEWLTLDHTAEVVLRDPEAVGMRGVSPPDGGSVQVVQLNSPPLLPLLRNPGAIRVHFNRWLVSAICEPNSIFPEECFPEDHEHWQREILTIIFQYYQQIISDPQTTTKSGPYHTLRRALKLVVFNHMMCHPWMVPERDIARLTHRLGGRYSFENEEWVCPRIVNKVMKAWLLPMLDKLARTVLSDLQKLLRSKGHEESLWDPLFCTIFLCLIVVGKFQVSFLERVAVGLANNDLTFLEGEARFGIGEMERELSLHLVGQFHARFGTNRKGNGNGKMFNPLVQEERTTPAFFSPLAQKVSFMTQVYGSHIFNLQRQGIPDHDLGAMKTNNVTRLLASFMEPFYFQ